MEASDRRRRSSLYPMITPRDSIDSACSTNTVSKSVTDISSHYMITGDNNVIETDKVQRLSGKYPQLKDKQMIVFVT